METTIYISQSSIFLPTTRTVEKSYLNGDKGEQLWEQIYEERLTGNLWTKREILSLNPVIGEIK